MRALFLAPELLPFGGVPRHDRLVVQCLDRYLAERGGRLLVHCLNDARPPELPEELSDIRATTLRYFARNRARFIAAFLREIPKCDVVLYGLLGFAPMALLQNVVSRQVRTAVFLHGYEAWERRTWVHTAGLRRIDSFISVSQYTLDTFRSAYRIPPRQRDYVLPNPLSPGFQFSPLPPGPDAGPPRLLSVTRLGVFDQRKGIDVVIRTLPELLRSFPDLLYRVIGDGSDRARLEALAREVGVEKSVRFLGFVSEETLRREMASCTVFVLPSTQEGFGFVYVEAMAYRRPVVAARATAVPEVVEEGKTGLLVEPNNTAALRDAVSRLLADGCLREQMGSAGRETVLERFQFEVFEQRLVGIWDSLLQR